MSATVIGLVRHGVTSWNKEQRAQGHTDILLSDEGYEQATQLAKRLENSKWDILISSDLQRAKETAKMIQQYLANSRDLISFTDSRLRERFYGDLEGTTLSERIERWGLDWENGDYKVEPEQAFQKRVWNVIDDLLVRYPGKRILLVTHGGFIRRVLRRILPQQNHDLIHNASLTIIEHKQNRWQCTLYNCNAHIQ